MVVPVTTIANPGTFKHPGIPYSTWNQSEREDYPNIDRSQALGFQVLLNVTTKPAVSNSEVSRTQLKQ